MPAADWLAVSLGVVAVRAAERLDGAVDLALKRVVVLVLFVAGAAGGQGRCARVRRRVELRRRLLLRATATGVSAALHAARAVHMRARDEQAVSIEPGACGAVKGAIVVARVTRVAVSIVMLLTVLNRQTPD